MAEDARLPGAFIIGAAKSGTTSLYRWLASQPEVFDATKKEPQYFSNPEHNGFEWYVDQYRAARDDELVIDASPSYTFPGDAARAATGIAQRCPTARIVYLLRHPLARLRSQYHFDRRRGLITGSLASVCRPPDDRYAGRSMYFRCLQPYVDSFPREQICVVRFEDLVAENGSAWAMVLTHLGLAPRERPSAVVNTTAARPQVPPLVPRLAGSRLRRRVPIPHGSGPRATSLLRWTVRGDPGLEASRAPIPLAVAGAIWEDAARLARWLAVPGSLWDENSDGNER